MNELITTDNFVYQEFNDILRDIIFNFIFKLTNEIDYKYYILQPLFEDEFMRDEFRRELNKGL